jgi:predicted flap endonuclease-1-like 5' DNA nuclease
MSYKIDEIEGIGPAYAETLGKVGITKVEHFLNLCCDKKGRQKVATETGISEPHLLKWANMADLMRIKGVATQFAELLECAGVDTVKELRTRRADNLAAKMAEVNNEKKLCKANPSEKEVADWIEQAKGMEPTVTH